MSLRTRSAFLARNISVINSLLNSSALALSLQSFNYRYTLNVLVNMSYFFAQFTKVLFPKTKFLKYVPIGVNFPMAGHYKGMYDLTLLLHGHSVKKVLSRIPNTAFKYPYFARHRIALTPVAKKPYSLALYKFLRMTLNLWFVWPRAYKLTSHFTDISTSWLLVKFLSKYFFKVYSI